MIEKFYVDSNGAWIGAFEGSVPDGGVEVPFAPESATQVWNASTQSYSSPQPAAYRISKTTPWLRMTDEEAATMDAVMSETGARLKQIYMAASYLASNDPLWATLHQMLADAFGNARADALLAPEG